MTTNLEPQWILGFTDGEGCFNVSIVRQKSMAMGFQVLADYTVVQHERDIQILHALKDYFGVGQVGRNNDTRQHYRVRGLQPLTEAIIPFFEKHQLKTKKRIDFIKFRRIQLMVQRGQHLTPQGLLLIDKIRQKINRGPKTYLKLEEDGTVEMYDHATNEIHVARKRK
uniref:Putative site-specific DNA endonuclease n=1 Tax=Oltmannsiellopsis viridis TaxID=51324 RepID=Q20EU0_OLTVI|nr:putative site-specific DNA endonuclease [Oltmannsiellopsis viridis]YP_635905.1 putative site-specific DNA endonuclease [Oltmannsiellopsis viridis]ABB81973.1 putative site-specific DNA endonuclease [Oltmannsiellopsis viridis]ABB82018.1 putative site-specific DNA endonuclease [Oltmannsiellopsis viridis]